MRTISPNIPKNSPFVASSELVVKVKVLVEIEGNHLAVIITFIDNGIAYDLLKQKIKMVKIL